MITLYLIANTRSSPSYSYDIITKTITISNCDQSEDSCIIDQISYQKSGPFQEYSKIVVDFGPKSIGSQAFYNSIELKEIYLSSTIRSITTPFCRYCRKLELIKVNDQSPFYESDDQGSLYELGQERLVKTPAVASKLTISNKTKVILEQAFNMVSFTSFVIPKSVIEIQKGSFYDSGIKIMEFEEGSKLTYLGEQSIAIASNLVTLKLGAALQILETKAIYNCRSLISINFGQNSNLTIIKSDVFSNCIKLQEIILPSKVKSILSGAFSGCTSLKTISLPASLEDLSITAFTSCSSLSTIEIDGNNQYYSSDSGALYNKNKTSLIVIPSSWTSVTIAKEVTEIGTTALQVCQYLIRLDVEEDHPIFLQNENMLINKNTGVLLAFIGGIENFEIPPEVTSLGSYCGYSLQKISEVRVPTGITQLGMYCFAESSITKITLSSTITSILDRAFESCLKLEYVIFPEEGNMGLSGYIFHKCSKMKELIFNCNISKIGQYSFSGCSAKIIEFRKEGISIADTGTYPCTNLENISFPLSLKTIANSAITSPSVVNIFFPRGCGITRVDFNGFTGCSKLSNIEFGSYLKEIGTNAFKDCKSLSDIILNDNCPLTEITGGAFTGCTGLRKITLSKNIVTASPLIFSGCENLVNIESSINSEFLESINGILYGKKDRSLLIVPPGLDSINLADKIVSLGESCFYGCSLLTKLKFPSSSKFECINDNTFLGCAGLEEISFPASLKTVHSQAMSGCESLLNVIFEEGSNLSTLSEGVFSPCSKIECANLSRCSKLYEVSAKCFEGCSLLHTVIISDEVTILNRRAFAGCSSLKQIDLPLNLEEVKPECFINSGLSGRLVLPNRTAFVGEGALSGCRLSEIYYCGTIPLVENAFATASEAPPVRVTSSYSGTTCLGVIPERSLSPGCYLGTQEIMKNRPEIYQGITQIAVLVDSD